jgi:hypothetical protein
MRTRRFFCHMSVAPNVCQATDEFSTILLGWLGMTAPHHPIRVLEADRYGDGIVITFADGKSIFYTPEFLYEHRGADGNREVPDDPSAL